MTRLVSEIIAAAVIAILFFALGAGLTPNGATDDLNKLFIPLMSMFGSWVSGLGTLVAAVVALVIANRQSTAARVSGAVKCIHHSMILTIDIKQRVGYIKKLFVSGERPLIALKQCERRMCLRYEALFDREIYEYLPSEIVDFILELSGLIDGLSAAVAEVVSELGDKDFVNIPPNVRVESSEGIDYFISQLDELFDKLNKLPIE